MEIAQIEYPATGKPQRCKHIATQTDTEAHRGHRGHTERYLHPLIYRYKARHRTKRAIVNNCK